MRRVQFGESLPGHSRSVPICIPLTFIPLPYSEWKNIVRGMNVKGIKRGDLRELPHPFFTKIFPGNCRTNRFISSPSSATDTAELGRPLRRITSSVFDSSVRAS